MTSTIACAVSAILVILALFQHEVARLVGARRWQRATGVLSVPLLVVFTSIVAARLIKLL